MARRPAPAYFTVSTERQIRVLMAPARMELLESLVNHGPASAADLAERTGRSPESMYYHIRLLRDIGVVRIREHRPGPRRDEAVFEAAYRGLEMRTGPADRRFRAARARAVATILRRVEREVRDAVLAERSIPVPSRRTTAVDREVIRIAPRDLVELNRRIADLLAFCHGIDRPDGQIAIALTLARSPIRDSEKRRPE